MYYVFLKKIIFWEFDLEEEWIMNQLVLTHLKPTRLGDFWFNRPTNYYFNIKQILGTQVVIDHSDNSYIP